MVRSVIVVVSALKGGVGKTTSSIYLAAVASATRRPVVLIDADPQASAAEWLDGSDDQHLQKIDIVEAPTDRLLLKALDHVTDEQVAIIDTPPGQERLLAKALARGAAAVVPTRVGGVETTRANAVFDLMPEGLPAGIVIASARTFTRDYQDTVVNWSASGVPVWGTVPERVAIAAGPAAWLSLEGLEVYRNVWRRLLRAARTS
jgi:chromosome partitioning protein